MNAETALVEAYQEWRRLAETEGDAVRTANWGLLAASQRALGHLRDRITTLTADTRREWAQFGSDVSAKEKNFRAIISELLQLERQNSTLLAGMQKNVKSHIDKLDQTGRNLRRIQRSYAPARQAAWTSFS